MVAVRREDDSGPSSDSAGGAAQILIATPLAILVNALITILN
jgi:hypothetical protein